MKHHLLANSIKSNTGTVEARNNIERDEIQALEDVSLETLITRRQFENNIPAPYNPPEVLGLSISAGQPDTKTLDATQLAQINSYGRVPNFVALVNGEQYTDIRPKYTGNPGNYSAIIVYLHSDGTGNNIDDTYIQFS